MIVKFLAKSKTFKGVRYNTTKVERSKGELMKVSGFGILQGMSQLMPQDYINYLQSVSASNRRVVYPQLHVVISAKGKDTTKEELTETADKWMQSMGYGDQPYLVIFHKDTRNHHFHVVSTRVDRNSGKKISSAYEKIRAMMTTNRIMKQDEKVMARADLEKAMKFNFQTKAQFMLILESMGYAVTETNDSMHLNKFGKDLLEFDSAFIKERKANYRANQSRAIQITALLHKFMKIHSSELRPESIPLPGGSGVVKDSYTSDLAIHMKQAFGIQLLFHAAAGKVPYGYSILDHAQGNVFKGGEIMDMGELLGGPPQVLIDSPAHQVPGSNSIDQSRIASSAPDLSRSTAQKFTDSSTQQISSEESFESFAPEIRIDISDDIDDEAIHRRNRHRKRQTRTSTR